MTAIAPRELGSKAVFGFIYVFLYWMLTLQLDLPWSIWRLGTPSWETNEAKEGGDRVEANEAEAARPDQKHANRETKETKAAGDPENPG